MFAISFYVPTKRNHRLALIKHPTPCTILIWPKQLKATTSRMNSSWRSDWIWIELSMYRNKCCTTLIVGIFRHTLSYYFLTKRAQSVKVTNILNGFQPPTTKINDVFGIFKSNKSIMLGESDFKKYSIIFTSGKSVRQLYAVYINLRTIKLISHNYFYMKKSSIIGFINNIEGKTQIDPIKYFICWYKLYVLV